MYCSPHQGNFQMHFLNQLKASRLKYSEYILKAFVTALYFVSLEGPGDDKLSHKSGTKKTKSISCNLNAGLT